MQQKYLDLATQGLVFLFPIVAGTVLSGASTVHGLLLALGLAFGWPAWRMLDSEEKKILIAFALFCALAGLSLIYTEELQNGIRRFERYAYFLLLAPLYMLLRRVKTEMAIPMLFGCTVAGIVMTGQALYDINVKGMPAAWGPYDKIVFGDIATLVAATAAAGALILRLPMSLRLLALAGSLAALYSSALAQARGGWVFLILAIPLTLWLYRRKISGKGWASAALAGIVAITALLTWPQNPVTQGATAGMADLTGYAADPRNPSSWGDRINTWKGAVAIWQANPIFGTGIGDFMHDAEQVRASGQTTLVNVYGHAHSIFFDTLATLGIIGLITLVICLFYLPFRFFYAGFSNPERDPQLTFYCLSGMLAVLAFGAFGLSEGWLSRNPMVKSYIVWVAVFMASVAIRRQALRARPQE